MKIRIRGNSVRLRLTKSEVDKFAQEGIIEEFTHFGPSKLTYALKKVSNEKMSATYLNDTITMMIPDTQANIWCTTERIGFDGLMDLGDGNELYLLLEKDYKCLDNTDEDQSDNYENPFAAQLNK